MTDPVQQSRVKNMTFVFDAADGNSATLDNINRVVFRQPVTIPNCTGSMSGQMTVKGDTVFIPPGTRFTAKWYPTVLDCPQMKYPRFNFSDYAYLADVVNKNWGNSDVIIRDPIDPFQTRFGCPVAALSSYYHASIQESPVASSPYGLGTQVAGASLFSTAAILPSLNTVTIACEIDTNTITGFAASTGLVSFLPWKPIDPTNRIVNLTSEGASVYNNLPIGSTINDTNAINHVSTLNCVDSPYFAQPGDLNVDYIYGQGSYSADWLEPLLDDGSCEGATNLMPWMGMGCTLPNSGHQPFLPMTFLNPMQLSNSTPAHQLSYPSSVCFIYDETLNPSSSLEKPILFPINNSEESAFSPFFCGENSVQVPQIGNTFLNLCGITTANPGWPIPVSQITLNAPNGTLSGSVYGSSAVTANPLLRPYSKQVDNGRYGPCPFLTAVSQDPTTAGNFVNWDFGMYGTQAYHGTYDFPHLYPPNWLTVQTGFCPSTFYSNTVNSATQCSNTFLTELPSGGWAAQNSIISSYRSAFIFQYNTTTQQFSDIVSFTSVIDIPSGTYSPVELQNLIQQLLQKTDQYGNTPFSKLIDFENGSYICVASDEEFDTVPWRNPLNNKVDKPNRTGPASLGHVGRGVHAFRPPNVKMEVGSLNFSISLGGQALFELSGANTSFTPSSLLVTSTYTAGQASSATLNQSYQAWIAPPVCGNYGYTVIGADGMPTATAIDPLFITQSPSAAPIDLYQIGVQSVLWPNECTRATGIWNKKSKKTYADTTQLLPGNTRGQFVQLSSIESHAYTQDTVRNTNPAVYVPERIGLCPYINPWINGKASGPTGLVLGSLCDGSDLERNFWRLLGFNPLPLENLWEPKIAYVRPVDGVYYDPTDQTYKFSHEAKCVTNEAPYLAYRAPEWYWQSQYSPLEQTEIEQAESFLVGLPFKNISFAANTTDPQPGQDPTQVTQTNAPLFMTIPTMCNFLNIPQISFVEAQPETPAYISTGAIYNGLFDLIYNPETGVISTMSSIFDPTEVDDPPVSLLMADLSGESGSLATPNIGATDFFLYNLYNCHSSWPVVRSLWAGWQMYQMTSTEAAAHDDQPLNIGQVAQYILGTSGSATTMKFSNDPAFNFRSSWTHYADDDVDYNYLSNQLRTPMVPGTCMRIMTGVATVPSSEVTNAVPGTLPITESTIHRVYSSGALPTQTYAWDAGQIELTALVEAIETATMAIPVYSTFDASDVSMQRPVRLDGTVAENFQLYIEGLSEVCFNTNAVVDYAPIQLVVENEASDLVYTNTRFSRLLARCAVTPANATTYFQRAVQCLGQRIPVAGYHDVSRITSWVFNSSPLVNYRGYSGLPTLPMISIATAPPSVDPSFVASTHQPATPAQAFQTLIDKLTHISDIICVVTNHNPDRLNSIYPSYPAGARANIANPYGNALSNAITIQPILPYSGQDLSEAIQIPYTSNVWPATLPPRINEDLNKYGCVRLRVWNNSLNTTTDSYFNADHFSDSIICQIAPDSAQLQVIPFNSSEVFEFPAQVFSELNFELTTLDNKEIQGITNLRFFLQLTPTNQQTALEAAFQNSADLSVLSQQAAPSVTQVNPNAAIFNPGQLNISAAQAPPKRAASEAFFSTGSGTTDIPSFGVPAKRKPPTFK